MKKKRIILSAYACEPNKGSEPGVGWHWANQIKNLGHDVLIITRKNNKKNIEAELSKKKSLLKKENFFYFELPKLFLSLKKKIPLGIYFYYFFWQFFLHKKIIKENIIKNYDLIHHLTIGTFRIPSFLWKLNKKFIFGPLGGYETLPYPIYRELNFKDYIFEKIRNFSNIYTAKYSYNFRKCLNNSFMLFTKNIETKKNILKFHKLNNNIKVFSERGHFIGRKVKIKKKKITKLLFIGRLIHWKGCDIAIMALKEALQKNSNLSLNIYGNGPDKKKLSVLIKNLSLDKKVKIKNFVNNKNIDKIYKSHDLLIFPSFHEATGGVILEALSNSLPVICFDRGGPSDLINKFSGYKIKINKNDNKFKLAIKMALRINLLTSNLKLYIKHSNGAYEIAKKNTWKKIVKNFYNIILN